MFSQFQGLKPAMNYGKSVSKMAALMGFSGSFAFFWERWTSNALPKANSKRLLRIGPGHFSKKELLIINHLPTQLICSSETVCFMVGMGDHVCLGCMSTPISVLWRDFGTLGLVDQQRIEVAAVAAQFHSEDTWGPCHQWESVTNLGIAMMITCNQYNEDDI